MRLGIAPCSDCLQRTTDHGPLAPASCLTRLFSVALRSLWLPLISPLFSVTHWVPVFTPLLSMSYWEDPSFLTSLKNLPFVFNNLLGSFLSPLFSLACEGEIVVSDALICFVASGWHGCSGEAYEVGTGLRRTFIAPLAYTYWPFLSRDIVSD